MSTTFFIRDFFVLLTIRLSILVGEILKAQAFFYQKNWLEKSKK